MRLSDDHEWLPPLCLFCDFDGDWARYEEALYRLFHQDWVVLRPYFRGSPVGHATEPIHKEKPEAFWHLTSQADREAGDRLPDLARCECIRWPKAIINGVGARDDVVTWCERTKRGQRQLIALDDFLYVVVLALRGNGKLFLATAYPVERAGRREKLRRQYNRARENGGA